MGGYAGQAGNRIESTPGLGVLMLHLQSAPTANRSMRHTGESPQRTERGTGSSQNSCWQTPTQGRSAEVRAKTSEPRLIVSPGGCVPPGLTHIYEEGHA